MFNIFHTDLVSGAPHGIPRLPVLTATTVAGAQCMLANSRRACADAESRSAQSWQHLLHEQRHAGSSCYQAVSVTHGCNDNNIVN